MTEDRTLLAVCRRFWTELEVSRRQHDAWRQLLATDHNRDLAEKAGSVANEAHKRMGATLGEIFATPAATTAGIRAKALILREAKDGEMREVDQGLTCWEDEPREWFDSLLADLDRMAGRASA